MPGAAHLVRNLVDLLDRPRRGLGIAGRPHLAAHARGAVRLLIDAQLHAVPLVGVPRERHAHGHLVGGLPRMQLELLAVAEQHQPVALVDQADVAALPALLAAAHVGFDGVAGQVRLAHEHLRAAADGVVARPHQHLAGAFDGALEHLARRAGPPRRRRFAAALSKSNVHGSGSITRTRAVPLSAADRRLHESGARALRRARCRRPSASTAPLN